MATGSLLQLLDCEVGPLVRGQSWSPGHRDTVSEPTLMNQALHKDHDEDAS